MDKDLEACSHCGYAVPNEPEFWLEGSHQEKAINRRAETSEMVLNLVAYCGLGVALCGFYHVFC